MQKNNQENTVPHLRYLDSMRGIAALSVMVYHFINWKYEDRLGAKIGSIIFNGSDAVSFFFVLSGFVLSYQYINHDRKLSIPRFYIVRFFRLWPAFFVIVVLNALNWSRESFNIATLSDVFLWNKTQFWQEALLIRSHPHYFVPGWTLTIELSISLIIPFIIVLAKANVQLLLWLLLATLIIGGSMGDNYMFHFHFILGVLLSCLYRYLNSETFSTTKWYRYRYSIFFAAMALYSIRHINRIAEMPARYFSVMKYVKIDFFHYTAIASFIFIAFLIRHKYTQSLLQHKALLFLGKISYGIYLSHWLLVTDIFIYWDNIKTHFSSITQAFIVIFCAYSITTIILATALHYLVEIPFIRLGKKIAAKVNPAYGVI